MEPGQVAYEGYLVSCGRKSIHGEELPGWDGLAPEIRAHWRAAMDAVKMFSELRARDSRPQRVHGRSPELWDALRDAGIVREEDYARRVIIDISVTSAVTIYIERYADTRVLELLPVLGHDRAEIRWADKIPETVAEAEQV